MYRAVVISEKIDISVDDENREILRNVSYDTNFRIDDVLTRFVFRDGILIKQDHFRVIDMGPPFLKLRGHDGEVRTMPVKNIISQDMKAGNLQLEIYWRIYERE